MAVDLNGSNQSLNCGSAASLDDVTTKTLACWVNLDAYGTENNPKPMISKQKGPSPYNGWYWGTETITTDKIILNDWGKWSCAGPAKYLWHHLAASYDFSSNLNVPIMYVDGVRVAVTQVWAPGASRATDAAETALIGYDAAYGFYYDGRIEDFRMLNRICTPSEMMILAAGYRGPLGGEVLWLPMDGARATAVFDGTALAANTNYLNDISGNGNHGNPTNNPLGKASSCPRANLWIPRHAAAVPTYMAPVVHNWLRQHGRESYYKWT